MDKVLGKAGSMLTCDLPPYDFDDHYLAMTKNHRFIIGDVVRSEGDGWQIIEPMRCKSRYPSAIFLSLETLFATR